MDFRTAYDGINDRSADIDFDPDSGRTRQSMKDECDINKIMGRYLKTGLLTHVNEHQGDYGEFVQVDFHEAMNTVIAAQEMFGTVPSNLREKFGNDPGRFLDFVTNPDNREEMRELGLLPTEKHAARAAADELPEGAQQAAEPAPADPPT